MTSASFEFKGKGGGGGGTGGVESTLRHGEKEEEWHRKKLLFTYYITIESLTFAHSEKEGVGNKSVRISIYRRIVEALAICFSPISVVVNYYDKVDT